MARSDQQAHGVSIRGLIGLALLLSVAPAVAGLSGELSFNWLCQCLLVAIPQLVWCALESRLQPGIFTRAKTRPGGLSFAQGLATLAVVYLAMWTAATDWYRPGSVDGTLAVLLIASGIHLRLRAIRDLGESFRDDISLGPGQALETSGIYREMRHPSELGSLLILSGTAWMIHSEAAGLLVAFLCLPLAIWRMRMEDQLLVNNFGDEARDYQQQTRAWSLLPLLTHPVRVALNYGKNR